MSWTDERIDRLKELWSQGMTASQIADELGGVSRNAVIGKAHRLGLQSRPSPVKPNEPDAPAKAPRQGRGRAARRAPNAAPKRRAAPEAEPPTPRRAAAAPRRRAPPPGRAAAAADPLDRPGRLRPPGPGRPAGADPAGAAAPAGAGQAERRGRRQDQPARSQREDLQMADRPSGRARFPLLRQASPIRASLIASSIAASPIRRSCRAATARPPPPLPFGGPRVR